MKNDITFRLLPRLDLPLLPQAIYTLGGPRYIGHGTFATDQAAALDLGAFRNGPASDALLVMLTHGHG